MSDFIKRFQPYMDRFDLQPSSYKIQNAIGESAGWVAKIHVVTKGLKADVWQELVDSKAVPPAPRTYDSKSKADAAALWMGLEWIEEHKT